MAARRFVERSSTANFDQGLKNKFKWEWLTEKDAHGELYSTYVRKLEADGFAWCCYCSSELKYCKVGKACLHQHSKTKLHVRQRESCLTNQKLASAMQTTQDKVNRSRSTIDLPYDSGVSERFPGTNNKTRSRSRSNTGRVPTLFVNIAVRDKYPEHRSLSDEQVVELKHLLNQGMTNGAVVAHFQRTAGITLKRHDIFNYSSKFRKEAVIDEQQKTLRNLQNLLPEDCRASVDVGTDISNNGTMLSSKDDDDDDSKEEADVDSSSATDNTSTETLLVSPKIEMDHAEEDEYQGTELCCDIDNNDESFCNGSDHTVDAGSSPADRMDSTEDPLHKPSSCDEERIRDESSSQRKRGHTLLEGSLTDRSLDEHDKLHKIRKVADEHDKLHKIRKVVDSDDGLSNFMLEAHLKFLKAEHERKMEHLDLMLKQRMKHLNAEHTLRMEILAMERLHLEKKLAAQNKNLDGHESPSSANLESS